MGGAQPRDFKANVLSASSVRVVMRMGEPAQEGRQRRGTPGSAHRLAGVCLDVEPSHVAKRNMGDDREGSV